MPNLCTEGCFGAQLESVTPDRYQTPDRRQVKLVLTLALLG